MGKTPQSLADQAKSTTLSSRSAIENPAVGSEASARSPGARPAAGKTPPRSKPKQAQEELLLATSSVSLLPSVSEVFATKLARLKISRIFDLALHFPYRFLDFTQITPINQLRAGQAGVFEGTVVESLVKPSRRSLSLVLKVEDEFGVIVVRFFRWYRSLQNTLAPGTRVRCYGTPYRLRTLEISHPRFERLNDKTPPLPQTLTPVYPSTAGLHQKKLTAFIHDALDVLDQAPDLNYLSKSLSKKHQLMPLPQAFRGVHQVANAGTAQAILYKNHPAVKTIIFHDILANLMALEKARAQLRQQGCVPIPYDKPVMRDLSERWPFRLTGAQKKAIDEIATDLADGHTMLRLLQGDVGSGKTVVAAFIAWQCRQANQQVALLAPTEILCEQHLETFSAWFSPQELRIELLTSSLTRKRRNEILTRIINHEVDLVIGTHALFQGDVCFAQLGLIIIDEQQRFGVEHRLKLSQNAQGSDGANVPHQLMMTATPIPRTLATARLSILDCSVLDKMPEGRSQIRTSIMPDSRRPELIERVREYVADNKQVFWVSPRIEEDQEKQELQSVKAIEKKLSEEIGAEYIQVAHGRLKASQRERIIGAFRNREFPILVATTVVEVGVDIPNATLMVIEHSERLGLSQIHQLRGRVGRGHKTSDCVLMYKEPLSEISQKRLQAARSTDGFELARKDLELRGAGEFFGTEQSGTLNMRVGNLFRDEAVLQEAHTLAKTYLHDQASHADAIIDLWVDQAFDSAI